jgi:sugar phosphate isomerase/epimerase
MVAAMQGDPHIEGRLGLNVPRETWPTPALLKAYEAAGFTWVQVYHGLNFRTADDAPSARALAERVELEERSLRGFGAAAARLGTRICVENLAPVYPLPPRVCHEPAAVARLVRRIASPSVAMLFDLGHGHIVAARRDAGLSALLEPELDAIGLFHVHDNLGARRHDVQAPGVDPLRLDLHLAPGAGTLPWGRIAGALRGHGAPLMLEVGAGHRLEPLALAHMARAALSESVAAAAA